MAIAFTIVVIAVIFVAFILMWAARIADLAIEATGGVDTVRSQTTSLDNGADQIVDSAVRILHMARTLRKVAVGK